MGCLPPQKLTIQTFHLSKKFFRRMWKEILLISTLCFLCSHTAATNLCDSDTHCICEEADEEAGMLAVLCEKLGLTSVPLISSWPGNTYSMDISRNNISALASSLQPQKSVQIFKMAYCHLKSIAAKVFVSFPNLKQLDISQNELNELQKDTFLGLKELKILNMSDNNIIILPDNIFGDLTKLEELKLSGNPIRYLEMKTFKQLDNLIILDISNIRAHSLSDGIFHFTPNLRSLDLSRNDFKDVPDSALKSAPKLEELYFNENKVTEINENSFKDLIQLKILELSEMSTLTMVGKRTFSTLKLLQELKLTSNARLSYIDDAAFHGIYNPADINSLQLKVLNLRNNDFSTLNAFILPWCEISTLDIQGNPWFCDCYMKWITNCSFPAELSNDLRCHGPMELKGRYLNQLTQEQYICLHQMAPNHYTQTQVRTIAAITGLALALAISVAVVLFVKRRSIKSWWSLRRRGQGAIYYVKAQTNPSENADL